MGIAVGSCRACVSVKRATDASLPRASLCLEPDQSVHFADPATSLIAPSNTSSPASSSSRVITSGGTNRIVDFPEVMIATPRLKHFVMISRDSSDPGSFVSGSLTISAPTMSPLPRTSPMIGWRMSRMQKR